LGTLRVSVSGRSAVASAARDGDEADCDAGKAEAAERRGSMVLVR
jgi:hypothetical protein